MPPDNTVADNELERAYAALQWAVEHNSSELRHHNERFRVAWRAVHRPGETR